MNFKNIVSKLSLTVVLLTFFTASSFAQIYVSNTNGNDIVGSGTQVSPYKTILKGYTEATNGQTIYVDADTYPEGAAALNLNAAKSVTFEALEFNGLETVTITNGVTMNAANRTVTFSASGKNWNFGTTVTALTLTAGTVNLSTNTTIGDGATITRTNGTLVGTPTFAGNTNVTYGNITAATIAAGPELPADIRAGILTVNIGAGKTITFANTLTATQAPTNSITVTTGHVNFNGAVVFYVNAASSPIITNNGTGNVSFNNAVNFSKFTGTGANAAAHTILVRNNTTGSLIFDQGYTRTAGTVSGASYAIHVNMQNAGAAPAKLTFNGTVDAGNGTLTNTSTGTITLTGGTISGDINNGDGGIIVLNANTTFAGSIDNSHASSQIKLNTYTLTLSGTTKTIDNTGGGKIYSSTASTVGTGIVLITGTYANSSANGEYPNVTVSGTGGSFTTTAGATLYGNLTIAGSKTSAPQALVDNAQVITLYGDFRRTNNTVGNVVATGGLLFTGTSAQNFTPGASLTLTDVTINKASNKVTLTASVNIDGDFTITAGELELGNFNINMINGGTFDNSGSFYSTTNVGYLNFETNGGFIQGTGNFGNILINSDGSNVTLTSNVDFSGTLYLFEGDLELDDFTFTMTNVLVTNPTVKVNTNPTTSAAVLNNGLVGSNLFDVAAGTTYNLEYVGALGGVYNAGFEWDDAVNSTEINNLSVLTSGGTVVTGPGGPSTIDGTLTVNDNEILDLNGQTATLSGDDKTHSVKGTVTDLLYVTGTGVALNGGTAAGDDNVVTDLEIDNTDGTFTSVRLKSITNLTNTSGTSTVTLSTAAGTAFVNDVTVTDGQLTINFGSTPIGNDLLVNGGILVLGSDIIVINDITHDGTSLIDLGNFDLVANNDYTHNNTATFSAGTGYVIFDAAADAAGTINLTTAVTIPNLEINAPAGVITLATDDLTVSNAFVFTDGTFDLDGLDLYITGSTFSFDVATPSVFDATSGASTLHFEGDATTVIVTDASDTWVTPVVDFSTAANQLNITVNTTGNTLTFADDADNGPFDFTVDGVFTQTMGAVALGDNNLILDEDFVRVEGTWSQGDGFMIWNSTSGSYTTGDNFIIDNLEIRASMADTDDKPWMVNKYLLLTGGTLTTTTDGNLQIADNATIERTLTTALLGEVPTFGLDISVIYSGSEDADITTDNELPATVKNLTLDRSGATNDNLLLNDDLLITGTFFLFDGDFDENSNSLTLGEGATLERQAGGTLLAGSTPTVTTYNLVYSGGTSFTTTARDFMTGLVSLSVELGAGAFVSLHANNTINGPIVINSNATGGLDLANRTLTAKQDVTHTAGRIQGTGGGVLVMGGDVAQNLTVPAAGLTFPFAGTAQLRINNSTEEGVTLVGGDLTISTTNAANAVNFVKGVFKTNANTLVLWHGDDGSQPLQGFTRNVAVGSYSHVVGNVRKYLNATGVPPLQTVNAAVGLTRVEFPVGTAPASPGNYRPMAFQFNTLPSANFNLTVSHVAESPGGENGFPLTSGDLSITNYPEFYWLVKSDLTLQPQVRYDIEARGDGYTDYQTDGVQNIRFIRRFDTNTNNPWLVQGGTGYDNSSFDYLNTPLILNDDSPIIIVRDAQGAISSQGARFTYSQLNKAPVIVGPADVTVAEGDTVTLTWTVTDPDIGQTPVVSILEKPAAAVFDAATRKLTWITTYASAGVHTIRLQATDGILTSFDTVTVTVTNVNRGPSFTAAGAVILEDTAIKSSETLVFTYLAIDPDGDAITYTLLPITPEFMGTASIASALGTLSFAPVFDDASKAFIISVEATDASGEKDTTTAVVTVGYPVAKGDVTGNGTIAADDASEILKYVVGLVEFTPQQLYAADVNNDGVVGALDAAWVLHYVVNGEWPTAKLSAAAGIAEFGSMASENGVISLPITLANTSGVLSAKVELDVNGALEIEGVASRLPEGWIMISNIEEGRVTIAMAGLKPLTDGSFATVNLKMQDKEAKATIQGKANLNDEYSAQLNSVTVKEIPTEFELSQNYPNPFNPVTNIKFSLPENANVNLTIYNMLGQKVKTLLSGEQEAGFYTVRWDGTNELGSRVSSGIYIYRIEAGKYTSTMKMNLLK